MGNLPSHKTVSGIRDISLGDGPPATFTSEDGPASVRQKFNDNFSYLEDFVDSMSTDMENTLAAIYGNGIVTGMEPSIGSGLTIDCAAGTALIGILLTIKATSIPVLANTTTGFIYLKQDGTFETNNTGVLPETSSFEYVRYTTDSDSVLSMFKHIEIHTKILTPKIKTISGSEEVIIKSESPIVVEITHTDELIVPGSRVFHVKMILLKYLFVIVTMIPD
jgi:hypothetical protein